MHASSHMAMAAPQYSAHLWRYINDTAGQQVPWARQACLLCQLQQLLVEVTAALRGCCPALTLRSKPWLHRDLCELQKAHVEESNRPSGICTVSSSRQCLSPGAPLAWLQGNRRANVTIPSATTQVLPQAGSGSCTRSQQIMWLTCSSAGTCCDLSLRNCFPPPCSRICGSVERLCVRAGFGAPSEPSEFGPAGVHLQTAGEVQSSNVLL